MKVWPTKCHHPGVRVLLSNCPAMYCYCHNHPFALCIIPLLYESPVQYELSDKAALPWKAGTHISS